MFANHAGSLQGCAVLATGEQGARPGQERLGVGIHNVQSQPACWNPAHDPKARRDGTTRRTPQVEQPSRSAHLTTYHAADSKCREAPMRIVMFLAPWAWLISIGLLLPSLASEWEEDGWQIPPVSAICAAMISTGMLAWFWARREFRRVLMVVALTIVAVPYFSMWWNSFSTQEERAIEGAMKWDTNSDLPRKTAEDRAWRKVIRSRGRLAQARLDLVHAQMEYAEAQRAAGSERPPAWLRMLWLTLPGVLGVSLLVIAIRMTEEDAESFVDGRDRNGSW